MPRSPQKKYEWEPKLPGQKDPPPFFKKIPPLKLDETKLQAEVARLEALYQEVLAEAEAQQLSATELLDIDHKNTVGWDDLWKDDE